MKLAALIVLTIIYLTGIYYDQKRKETFSHRL